MSYIGNEPIVSATRTITEVTATAGQTVFTANGGYTVGYIDVFLNGAQLQTVDFTATNGTTITLTEAAQVGDVLKLVAWGTFNTNSVQGNLALTGTAARITGDFNNGTIANRTMFQGSVTNGGSVVSVIPNGTSTSSQLVAVNNSDPTNAQIAQIVSSSSEASFRAAAYGTGTGSYLPITMYTGGSERLRIDTSGNVGIGTSSPAGKLDVAGAFKIQTNGDVFGATGNAGAIMICGGGAYDAGGSIKLTGSSSSNMITFQTGAFVERGRFDSSGNFQFNSGYGSVATAYGCRAWVTFAANGTISASGNISSVSDNGTGDYTVNFTTAMPDGDYAVVAMSRVQEANICSTCLYNNSTPSTTSFRLSVGVVGNAFQDLPTRVAVFR